jgi:hypothetical protein
LELADEELVRLELEAEAAVVDVVSSALAETVSGDGRLLAA